MFVNAHLPERRDSRYRQCAGNLPGFIKSPERPGRLRRGCKGGRLQPFNREGLGGVVQPPRYSRSSQPLFRLTLLPFTESEQAPLRGKPSKATGSDGGSLLLRTAN